jgi:hypothetical protein
VTEPDKRITRTLRRAVRDPAGVTQDTIARALFGDGIGDDRCSGRMGVRLQAALRSPRPRTERSHAVITDVGLSGICAEVEDRPPEPGPVTVEMCLPAPGPSTFLRGRISWVRNDLSPTRVGVELDDDCAWTWFAALKRMVDAVTLTPRHAMS